MNELLFGAYAATVTAAASFICGYIWQTLIQENINGN